MGGPEIYAFSVQKGAPRKVFRPRSKDFAQGHWSGIRCGSYCDWPIFQIRRVRWSYVCWWHLLRTCKHAASEHYES